MKAASGLVTTGIIPGMTEFHDKLDLTQELHTTERTPAVLFAARVLERGLQQVATGGWATAARSLEGLSANLLHRVRGEGNDHVIAERDGTLVQLGLYSGGSRPKSLQTTPSERQR